MKHTEKYHSDKANAGYYLVKGLMLAFNAGLINFEMIKWVLKSVERSKQNREFGKLKEDWKRWPSYIAADLDSKTFEYLSHGGILYYRWA